MQPGSRVNNHRYLRRYTSAKGFTLLELLVAIVIFAIMSIMAYGGLSNVINNSEGSKQSLARLQQLQHAISMLNRDFNQIRKRDIRDAFGEPQAFLTTGRNIDHLVELTRGGRLNPANLRRSSLLRVAYRLEENKLIRMQWPFLDPAPGTEPRESTLIDNVEEVRIRYLDDKAEWQEQWPPLNSINTTQENEQRPQLSPVAIEVILILADWGEIRRLYALQ